MEVVTNAAYAPLKDPTWQSLFGVFIDGVPEFEVWESRLVRQQDRHLQRR